MGMGGRVSNQGPHKQVQMQRVKARFSHFKTVYYNLEGVPAPDPLRVPKLRKRKYSFRRRLSWKRRVFILGGRSLKSFR
jgi:hypothetical protein